MCPCTTLLDMVLSKVDWEKVGPHTHASLQHIRWNPISNKMQNPISHKMQNLGCWAQFYHNKSLQIIEEMFSLLIVELQLENVTHVYEPNKANKLKEVSNGCGAF